VKLLIWDGTRERTGASAQVVELAPGEVYEMEDAWYAVGVPAEAAQP
jgi:hypothetical protein